MKKIIVIFLLLFLISTAYSLSVNLVLNPGTGNEPLNVKLTANVNDAPENAPRIFDWDFEGDGTIDATTNSPTDSITHTYSSGNYNPTVKVTNKLTEEAEDSKALRVMESGNTPPIADAGGPYKFFPGLSDKLDGTKSKNQEGYHWLTFTWELTTEKGNPECTFDKSGTNIETGKKSAINWIDEPPVTCNNSGTAKVTLTVTDSKGATDSDSTTIKINPTQTTDKINIVKMEINPEIIKTGDDLTVIVRVRNATNTTQTFDISYQIKKDIADTNISGLPNLIAIPSSIGLTVDGYDQKDFIIKIPYTGANGIEQNLEPQKNYWVYVIAEAPGETDKLLNTRRTIFNYFGVRSVQIPETNFTGLMIALFLSLIILKKKKR